jgi:multidrug efflux pump subunit AcrB
MCLLYVVLIGGAGYLLVTTPQGFIPAQDRGYVIVSVAIAGAASLARTTEVVRQIEADRAQHARHRAGACARRSVRRDANPVQQRRSAVSGVREAGEA